MKQRFCKYCGWELNHQFIDDERCCMQCEKIRSAIGGFYRKNGYTLAILSKILNDVKIDEVVQKLDRE